jgi:alpha-L-fucosidase
MALRYFTIPVISTLLLFISCTPKKTLPPAPMAVVPSAGQLAWQEMEMNAFIHFTINTFTDKEWGYGDESPELFNPTELDVDQWAGNLKNAGFKGIILTCKHHDGFSLYPTKYSEHSIKNSPYKNGKGDIVREVAEACKKYGLKFGVYLSPWDRNRADYGEASYITYYRDQLKEIFTQYGPIFEMWFDGANGGDGYYGGANGERKIDKTTYYDWDTTLDSVAILQPQVLFFSDAGPHIRWCGNEEGRGGETNWNTITTDTLYAGQADIGDLLNRGSEDGKNWVPAEVNTSIRPGWFYHASEDSLVRSPENLFKIYLQSVGRGSNLLLNIPPDTRGLFHENDVASLKGFKKLLDNTFANDIAPRAKVIASSVRGNDMDYGTDNLLDGDRDSYWATDDDITTAHLVFQFQDSQEISYIVLQEHIKLGQRVKAFHLEAKIEGEWKTIAEGTTIGYKRILPLKGVVSKEIRVVIDASLACPVLSEVQLFQ